MKDHTLKDGPERPLYRTLEPHFVAGVLVDAGVTIPYDGEPGSKLAPVNALAEEAVAAAEAKRKAAELRADRAGLPLADRPYLREPAALSDADRDNIAALVAKAVADATAEANAKLAEMADKLAAFDRDGDGKPGGSLPQTPADAETAQPQGEGAAPSGDKAKAKEKAPA